jgi:hypothetical protein
MGCTGSQQQQAVQDEQGAEQCRPPGERAVGLAAEGSLDSGAVEHDGEPRHRQSRE